MRTLTLVLLSASLAVAGPDPADAVRPVDLDRIRELYRLTDLHGEALWPGFDARKVPIGVNHEDRLELLIAHPQPPEVFRVLPGRDLKGEPILVRDGCDRFGPGNGGVAADLYGIYSVYMNTMQAGNTTENYLSVFLHECFHVHQRRYREPAGGRKGERPKHDPTYSALIGLESRILHAAAKEKEDRKARELVRLFVAVRRERRAGLTEAVVRAEGDEEYNEGTATYIQVRLLELLVENGKLEPEHADPHYHGFPDAAADRARFLEGILPPKSTPIRFRHAQYHVGMAQCLMLDRFRPGWKEELRARGSTLTGVLEREFPVEEAEAEALSAAAKRRFAYAPLLAKQKTLVERELARIRRYVEGPGRRYRIRTGTARGVPKARRRGPAYRVPEALRPGPGPLTVWAQGLWYQRGGLILDTKRVPVLVHAGYVEWIDREPAEDGSDLRIEFERREGGAYVGLRVTTDGFVLTLDRGTVTKTKDLVTIRPVPRRRGVR